ncbi:nucleotidyltransferase domain-containing protein [bacterium]|nr:nucleotidyltransferase domain-containing protein [bacterium]
MNTRLKKRDIDNILKALKQCPEVEEAIIFGSRAKGNCRPGSDVDLAVKGKNVTHDIVLKLLELLNCEFPLPYFFDVVHYEKINSRELVDHIDRVGEIVYSVPKAIS